MQAVKRRIAITGTLLITILIALGAYLFSISPKIKVTIEEVAEDNPQEQALIVKAKDSRAEFSLRIIDKQGIYSRGKLVKKLSFSRNFPFIDYSNNLTLIIKSNSKYKDSWVLYEVSGEIYNLRQEQYTLDVIDSLDNLIDSRTIHLEK